MSEPVTDPRAATDDPAADPRGPGRATVADLAAAIATPDVEAGIAARRGAPKAAGRLASLGRWLAETQGHWPPDPPRRCRLLVFGASPETIGAAVAATAAAAEATVRPIVLPNADGTDSTESIAAAFATGIAAADTAVDEGADLLIVTGSDGSAAASVLVSAFTGTEPVALLPRGAGAVDTAEWIARATVLRDQRRRVIALRHEPDELLAAAGSSLLAAAAGCILRGSARRTPIVLDGTAAVSAALLCHEQQPGSARWWQVADGSPDPTHARAVEDIDCAPLLDLRVTRDDGTAGLLTLSMLRMAAMVAAEAPAGRAGNDADD